MTAFSPIEHYNYPVLDVQCCCTLCTQWRRQRELFDEIKAVTFDHNRSCMCWRCRRRRQLQQGFLATSARRELYCELSWHASRHANTYGPQLMSWAAEEIKNWPETDGWWATISQALALSYWLSRFQSSGVVSGSAAWPASGMVA